MVVKVKQTNEFLKKHRDINAGDKFEVNYVSKWQDQKTGKEKLNYLVDAKNGKPITLYEEEVEVL